LIRYKVFTTNATLVATIKEIASILSVCQQWNLGYHLLLHKNTNPIDPNNFHVEYLMQLLCNAVFEITCSPLTLFINKMYFYFRNTEFSGAII